MSARPIVRNYNFEDAVLLQEAGRIHQDVQRDLTDFKTRGIADPYLADFQKKPMLLTIFLPTKSCRA